MKLKIGYLRQFIRLFGVKYGVRLYRNISVNRLNSLLLPNIKFSITLRPDTTDLRTFYQIFVNNEYDIKFPISPKVIIDGGANIGLFSILMLNKFNDAKVIAIEPDLENYAVLKENLAEYDTSYIENAGIWNKTTKLNVFDKFNSGHWGMVVEENESGNINAISIDSIITKYNIEYIDILKLDIETSEKQLFSKNYELWLPKTRIIIIELHDWMEEGCSKTFFAAINKCINNYELITSGENIVIVNKDLI